jgi:hypothetical protein
MGAALIVATAIPASAEEAIFSVKTPLFTTRDGPRPLFEAATPAQTKTPAPAAASPTSPNEHQFGAGLRIGGVSFGAGGSIRYFFYSGPLGVQAEVTHYRFSIDEIKWSAIQFSPSAIYRFSDAKFQGPYRLTPYVGLGMSFIHTYFEQNPNILQTLNFDDTSLGVLLYGGAELSFSKVPNLTVSGELVYISNAERLNADVNSALPWPAFVAAGHWYFW